MTKEILKYQRRIEELEHENSILEKKLKNQDSFPADAKEYERKLKAALESMSDAVFISDTEGNFIDFNEAFATFHKFMNKQECAKTLTEYPGFLDVYSAKGELLPLDQWVVPRALRGESGINEEFTLVRKDTHEKWEGSYNYAPIKNSKNHIVGSVVTAKDITKSKRAKSELIKAKEKAEKNEKIYRALFNSIPDTSILLFDKNLRYIEVGGNEVEKSGFDKSLIKGKTLQESYPKDVVEIFEPLLQKGFRGESTTFEMQYAKFTYLQKIVPVSDDSGNIFATMQIASNISGQKKAEEKLKESEERFRTFVNASPFPIVVTDAGHEEIIYWSESATKLFGHQPKTSTEWFHLAYPDPQYRQAVIERSKPYLEQARHSKAAVNTGVYEIVCKDGTVKTCEIYAQFVSDFLILASNDITEKTRTEKALKESENLLRNIIDSSTDYIFVKDKELKTVHCNKTFARAVNKEPSDLIGKTDIENGWDAELVKGNPEKGIKGYEQDDLEALNGKIVQNTDTATISGNTFYFDSVKIPLKDENNEIFGVLGISRDITERKKVEKALKNSEERHRLFYNPSFGGSIIHDKGIILDCSKGIINITGYSYNELIGMYGLRLIAPEWRDYVTDKIASRIEEPYETEAIRKDGTIFPVRLHAKAIQYRKKNVRVVEFRDITELKKKERIINQQNENLKKLNADKDRFMTILAHDLKSPFNSLLGFLDILTENIRKYDIDKIEKQLNIVNKSTQNTFSLLEDILMWVRANSGKIPFNPKKLDFVTICVGVIESLQLTANNKNITINNLIANETIIFADRSMLNAVLRNLISNAIKFTEKGGKIDIYANQENSHITISVSDNGVGIEPNTIPKLFDITHKISTAGTDKESGTGLGLLLCKEFVEKHGGKIWAESEFGKGSTFRFKIPVKDLQGND